MHSLLAASAEEPRPAAADESSSLDAGMTPLLEMFSDKANHQEKGTEREWKDYHVTFSACLSPSAQVCCSHPVRQAATARLSGSGLKAMARFTSFAQTARAGLAIRRNR
jgi:hypothetical protein